MLLAPTTGIALRFFVQTCSKYTSVRAFTSRQAIRCDHLLTGSTPIGNHEKIPLSWDPIVVAATGIEPVTLGL